MALQAFPGPWDVTKVLLVASLTLFVLMAEMSAHELTHAFAALLVGLKVDGFSLGIGPIAIRTVWKETEVRVCWLPLRGHVAVGAKDSASVRRFQAILFQLSPVAFDLVVFCFALRWRPDSGLTGCLRVALIGASAVMCASAFSPPGDLRRALGEMRIAPSRLPIGADLWAFRRIQWSARHDAPAGLDEARWPTASRPALTCAIALTRIARFEDASAIPMLRRLLATDLEDHDRGAVAAILALMLLSAKANRDSHVEQLLQIATGLRPNDVHVRAANAIALARSDQFGEAAIAAALVHPRLLRPDWRATFLCARASVLLTQGETRAAKSALSGARRAWPDCEWAKQIATTLFDA